MKLLEGWDNFYVILGSAAAALIGLTFVVIALLADARRASSAGVQGYITPTIVHFGCVLVVALYLSVPAHTRLSLSIGLAIGGIGTLIYSAAITYNVRRFAEQYAPVLEDWVWHVILPTMSYAALLGAAFLLWYRLQLSLYGVAAALTLLLVIGIHNALDVAVSVTVNRRKDDPAQGGKAPPDAGR
jgi:hypothetical protein